MPSQPLPLRLASRVFTRAFMQPGGGPGDEKLGGSAYVHTCDVGQSDAVEELAAEVHEEYGHVDVLVNNAGKSIRRSIELS